MIDKPVPVFTHITKTAGITLHGILEWQYRHVRTFTATDLPNIERYKSFTLAEKKKIKMIKGHLLFGVHEYCPYPVSYFTILRNPRARAISEYNYCRTYKRQSYYQEMKLKQYTLKEFLQSGLNPGMDNCHVRFLAGVADIPYGGVNEAHLALALYNLETYYKVGITERFDESILLFAKDLGWTTPYYSKQNVTSAKVEETVIDAETEELLKHYNRYDEVLYKKALEMFEVRLAAAGPEFREEVSVFAEKNKKRATRNKIDFYMGLLRFATNPYNMRTYLYDEVWKQIKIKLWYLYKGVKGR